MEQDLLEKVCKQVYRKFPEMSGKKPKVKPYGESGHLLIFEAKVSTADGKTMPRAVRVVVDERGRIGKITTSR